jgi:hypothetical protein
VTQEVVIRVGARPHRSRGPTRWAAGSVLAVLIGVAARLETEVALATPGAAPLPDLVVAAVTLKQLRTSSGPDRRPCHVFNVVITVRNQGRSAATTFSVLLEQNKGIGGSFEEACPLCTFRIEGLPAGATKILEARQLDDCSAPQAKAFRVTIDSGKQVVESNELNNTMVRISSFPTN